MVAGSLLPVALHKGKLYFLFGKENPMEDSSKGWSDFGGGCETGETPYQTALREGSEELTGFLGDKSVIMSKISSVNGYYELVHNDYHVHIFLMDYDTGLPVYFNNNHHFLWNKMDKKMLNASKLFEKIEINWFSEGDLSKRREEFRYFYREIVDKLKANTGLIKDFLKKSQRKTRKRMGGKYEKTRKYKGGCGCGAKKIFGGR
jgi:hypothetical protein